MDSKLTERVMEAQRPTVPQQIRNATSLRRQEISSTDYVRMTLELRETLTDVLAEVVDNERKTYRRQLEEFKIEAEATIARLQDTIEALEAKALAHIQTLEPVHGKDGRDGLDGKDGVDGLPGVAGRDGVDGAVGVRGAPGMAGKDGEAGRDGRDGLAGVQGPAGLDGKDGVDGKDGKNGVDGFGFDDLCCSYDGDRTITLAFVQADRTKEFSFKMPIPLDRGIFRSGMVYDRGDSVTYGGSCWLAQKDGPHGKPGESPDWRLSTKHGRDGKQGERGLPGKDGKDGRPGKDLTQLGPDGSKW
jgi:Collagen triple helix repeat (20 copies)